MPIIEISIVPVGTYNTSVSQYIAKSLSIIEKQKNIKYQLTSMGTIIEGDSIENLLRIAARMHNSVFNGIVKRVVTTIKIDERKDKVVTMDNKITSVKEKLNKR
jgi:uncharacterized protein (TIGR00106 family)